MRADPSAEPVTVGRFILAGILTAILTLMGSAPYLERYLEASRSSSAAEPMATEPVGGTRQMAIEFTAGKRVEDQARFMRPENVDRLESLLADFESSSGDEIGVVTIPNLGGRSIEDVSIELAMRWGLGRRGEDRGVMLLLAREDRELRIEVGYGLEAKLTDAQCHRIIQNELVPRLKADDPDGAVSAGVEAIIRTVAPEYRFPMGWNSALGMRGGSGDWSRPEPASAVKDEPAAGEIAGETAQDVAAGAARKLIVFWLLLPFLWFEGWIVCIRKKPWWLLLVPMVIALYALQDIPMALLATFASVMGMLAMYRIYDMSIPINGGGGGFGWSGSYSSGSTGRSSSSSGGGGSFGGGGASGRW